MMARLKERAQQEPESSVGRIIDEEALRDPEASYEIPATGASRAMKRARGATQPAIPRTLEDMTEEMSQVGREELRSTSVGSQFFLDEPIRGADGETLAEGFVSQRMVAHLRRHPAEASQLLMDATFKTLPRRPEGVHQFFSVHVLYVDVAVPVAFFLMKRRTEDSYRRVLSHMRENFLNWNFMTITTDFEVGQVNAIRAVFPEARHIGCWFHFCQAIWRYVVAEGLTASIRADFEVKKVVKMFMALLHLPPHPGPPHDDRVPPYGIADGLNAISNYIDEGNLDRRLQNAVAYVRRYWVGVIGVESLSTFQAPRRTNNYLESFHSRMLAAFGVNLDIWSFIIE
ncbi:uncharacterized protein LOC111057354 [Nilaparvata lugens]|uniref:uncharacterized protein LOC111057354 n=1 Tax=Nilaparvata lugens TaxID=108931 RepID=UPI00193D458A|nr:uncharacterized protein LOC111057354 [Nilaparvata lugens]